MARSGPAEPDLRKRWHGSRAAEWARKETDDSGHEKRFDLCFLLEKRAGPSPKSTPRNFAERGEPIAAGRDLARAGQTPRVAEERARCIRFSPALGRGDCNLWGEKPESGGVGRAVASRGPRVRSHARDCHFSPWLPAGRQVATEEISTPPGGGKRHT